MQEKSIHVKDLQERLSNLADTERVIDVRSDFEFAEVRIDDPQIENIDLNTVIHSADQFKDQTLYLICNSGNRSGLAQILLGNAGIDCVNVEGGMMSWMQADLPIKSEIN